MSDDIKKDRSPNYPKLPLKEAVDLAKTLYKKAGKAKIKAETAFGALGYSGPNGAALTTLGTLTAYGLIERDRGVGLSVSPLAIQLIHPTDPHQERFVKAQSALLPKVFLDLYNDGFRDADEDVLRNHLIQKGFTPDGAGVAAGVYVKNFSFAELEEFRSNSDMVREQNPELKPPFSANQDTAPRTLSGMPPAQRNSGPSGYPPAPTPPPAKANVLASYSVPLGSNEATITFTGKSLSPEDFVALIEYIQIFKKQFERKVQSEGDSNLVKALGAFVTEKK